ncbi:PREDICTED: putative GPI-anchored protein PB15E9.01c isoform X2 [Dinoponera quadriceps]|uniref:protein-tyrosine-phosphatase n=1 Tax=Dinoponera quadriceps TaxID=609295 RepID=A0A6P3X7T0_DINQU|nr:PREDICTED: putative GPI-anchored protein PB15E9.01c isoform X2 [Dinoponera quadriceps]
MTRRGTTVFALGVCIGTFLLLFGDALAEVTERTSSTPSGRLDSQATSTPRREATPVVSTRTVSPNQSIIREEEEERNVEPATSRGVHDEEDGSRNNVGDEGAGRRDEEKSDAPSVSGNGTDDSAAGEIESLSEGRKPRYGEISTESSGKSAKAERAVGLSRTNELTVATTKPALNDSKQDNKRNSANATLEESPDEGVLGESVSPKEELAGESTGGKNMDVEATSADRTLPEETSFVNSEDGRRNSTANVGEITTVASTGESPTSEEVAKSDGKKDRMNKLERKELVPKPDANLARLTEDAEESRDRESTTARGAQREDRVPKSGKVVTAASEAFDLEKIDEKGHEGAVSLINDTYVNYKTESESDGSGRSSRDPKKEVEIVEDVSHQPVLKIVAIENGTAGNDSHANELAGEQGGIVHDKRGGPSEDEDREERRTLPSGSNATASEEGGTGEWKSESSQLKPLETTIPSVKATGRTSPEATTPSPIPQGRTIGFPDVNEFPSVEVKPTAPVAPETLGQKPYPYVKSGVESPRPTTPAGLRSRSSSNGDLVEETSAYENTIGREDSGRKFIVTEPSVVIENSILQQKPDDKGRKESANSTTESPSLATATVIPGTQEAIGPTNETFPAKSYSSATPKDDAPQAAQGKAAGDEGYDVTGNGITEVGLPSEASGRSEPSSSRSTPTTTPASLNTDIQTDPEEAMMIRSTLDVTESTIVPLDTATPEANKSTSSMTPEGGEAPLENTTESMPTANATLQPSTESPLPSTLNPDESPVPTSTSIEFEFIGLTEAPNGTNTTEKSTGGRIFEEQTVPSRITIPIPTIPDSSTRNSSAEEETTRAEDSTELLPTTMDQASSAMNESTEVKVPPAATRSTVDEPIGNEVTTIDFTDSPVTEDPPTPKDSRFDANVTETSAPTDPPPGVTTPTNATKSPPAPFAPTLEPEVPTWAAPNSTESAEEEVTKSIPPQPQDEVTSLVKIVMEGSLQDICPHLPELRSALASGLTDGMDKLVSWKQIFIHQNPCLEPPSSTPTSMDVASILVYVVDEDGKFDAAMTKFLPNLEKVLHDFPVRIRKFVLVPEADSGNAIAVVVVSSVAFICLVLLAGLLFIMRKRQTRFNYGERCRPVSLDAYSLDSVSAYSSVRRKVAPRTSKRSYGNPTFEDSSAIPSHPLNFAGLSSFYNDVNVIDEEFSNIPQVSVKIDELPPGTEVKNRYANVIPLPETRVPLERLNNDATSEYINASYVRFDTSRSLRDRRTQRNTISLAKRH